MNHLSHYIHLIRKAQKRQCGVEKHHIFPRAIFGENDGVVLLTMREHYVAHKLLFHICKSRYGNHPYTYKMALACEMMGNRTSHYYETTRQFFIENHHTKTEEGSRIISNRMKGNTHHLHRHPYNHTEETKQKNKEWHNRTYEVTFTNGDKCVIVGLKDFAMENNYNNSHLTQISKGRRKRHKNIIGVTKID